MSAMSRSGKSLVRWAVCAGVLLLFVGLLSPLCSRQANAEPKAASRRVRGAAAADVPNGGLSLQHSRTYVHVDKTNFLGHEHAVEGRLKSGTLHLSGDPSFGELVFDMASFDVDTPAARKYIGLPGTTDNATKSKVTANMRGADVLNVRRYPTAKFVVKSIAPLKAMSRRGLPQYQIDGEFTLCGQTRPIKMTADAEQKGDWLHLRGGFSIQQTQFGMTPFSVGLGAIGVADRLKIWGDLWVANRNMAVGRDRGAAVQ